MPRETELIAGQIEGGNTVAVRQQGVQLFFTGGFAKGATHNANQARINVKRATAFFHPGNHRFNHAVNRQTVVHCHITRGKT